ncbi:MAG: hypothetical protein ABIP77_10505 [Candidatus Limnocylindrales bacterium]
MTSRRVSLRSVQRGSDRRRLEAYLDAEGDLHIDGQDLGPGTGPLGADGEVEWFQSIRVVDLPALRALLGIDADAVLLDALEESWTGPTRSRDLETRIRESGIPTELDTWRS